MPLVSEDQVGTLLADGSITAITIDTSIFDQKRLRLNSVTMQSFASLKDRPFDFLLSETVANEVIAHLKKAAEEALQSAKKGIGKALFAFETEEPTREALLAQISGGRTAEEAALQRWQKYLDDTGCKVLADTELVGTKTLFDDYFAGQPPFGTGRKKDEFPDSLALNALEQTAKERGNCILVVSQDGDWRSFCEHSDRLYLVPEIERALALITDAPLGLREAVANWLSEDGEGRDDLLPNLERRVERVDFYAYGHSSSGEMEAIAWAGILREVLWPADDDIDIIEVAEKGDDGVVDALVSIPLTLSVRVPVELSFSVWDGIDKESVSLGGREIDVDCGLDVRVTVELQVHDLSGEDEEVVYVDSTLDIQSYDIDLGEVDVFESEDYWDGDD